MSATKKAKTVRARVSLWSDEPAVGSVVYLVEVCTGVRGVDHIEARRSPLCTNISHEPRLRGWCGETNNVSRYAVGAGIVRATKEDADGNVIAMVEPIADTDERIAEEVRS